MKKNMAFIIWLSIMIYINITSVAYASLDVPGKKESIDFLNNLNGHGLINGQEVISSIEAGILADSPDYEWWKGCSPTSAGMMMGYYDMHGYNGKQYDNLVPSVTAEMSNYNNTNANVNQIIASTEHIADYYVDYLNSNNDPNANSSRTGNCLADFMGTSQDRYDNPDGATQFWVFTDGSRLYAEDLYSAGSYYYDSDGMFGLWICGKITWLLQYVNTL